MLPKKRFWMFLTVLGLSLGMVSAALAAANSVQSSTVQGTNRVALEADLPAFENLAGLQRFTQPDRFVFDPQFSQKTDTISNRAEPPPDEMYLYPPNLAGRPNGSAFIVGATRPPAISAQFSGMDPLAPPLPTGAEDFAICLDSQRVWGSVGPGETVTVMVNGTQMGAAVANEIGFFWTTLYDPDGNRPGLGVGDVVTIYTDGVQQASLTLRDINAEIDVLGDIVSGAIGGSGFPLDVTVYARESEPSMTANTQTSTTNSSGEFSVDFSGIWDFFADDGALVAYNENGVEVHRQIYAQRLVVLPYPHLAIVGGTTPGANMTATVYLADGISIREQMLGMADGKTGRYEFYPSDLQEGDIVVVEIAGGPVLSRTIDTLSIHVDATTDRITGEAEPGALVRGIARNMTYLGEEEIQATATANGGTYTLDFAPFADIMPGMWSGVYVADAEGDDLVLWAPTPSVEVNQTWNEVTGYGPANIGAESDGLPITLTLASNGAEYYTTAYSWGWYAFSDLPDLAPGEVVTVRAQGYAWEGVVALQPMDVQANAAADQFSGEVTMPTGRVELAGNYYQGQLYPLAGQFQTLANVTGDFSTTLTGFDVNGDLSYDLLHRTTGDYAERISRRTDGVGAGIVFNGLSGFLNPPGVAYTLTLLDSSNHLKAEITGNSFEPDGNLGWINLWDYGAQIQPGDSLEAQSAAGYTHTVVIPDLIIDFDPDADVIFGQGPANKLLHIRVEEGDQYQGFVPTDSSGHFKVAVNQLQQANGDGDVPFGQLILVTYYDERNTWLVNSYFWPQVRMDVNYAHDWVEVQTRPNEVVTVTVDGKAMVVGLSGGDGWFRSYEWPWTPEGPNLQVGDVITAEAIGLVATVNPVGRIKIEPDYDNDLILGTIEAPWFSPQPINVSCDIWIQDGPPGVFAEEVDPAGGSFTCDFTSVGWDVQPNQTIAVRYWEPDGDSVINVYDSPWMRVNYGHDWVGGTYEAGHTFWITVTNHAGALKGTAEVESVEGGGWGGDGFETRQEHWASHNAPDIVSGDWIYIAADDDYFNAILVGEIEGTVDVDADSVSGPIYADWFTTTLAVECHPWGAWGGGWYNAPVKNSSAEPDGSAPYLCQWDPNTEWDVEPGQDVAVMYREPDNDLVINVFQEPAPNLRIEKWADGSGQAMPGGPVVFSIRYRNEGNATAETFIITDTLPSDTLYDSDTSGMVPTFGPGWVAWAFGPLAPGEEETFQLFLSHTASPGECLHNQVDIRSQFDQDWYNNHAEADACITDEAPNLYVNKNPIPGDPTPGQTMLWEIHYGNDSPVASGLAVLTETLPENTTVMAWYSQSGFDAWYDYGSTDEQLVLAIPGIPGYWGDTLLVWLAIDSSVAYGTQLTNLVEIATAAEPLDLLDNNWQVRDDVWVSPPRWDGTVWKVLNWATTIPNGQIEYALGVRNHGNMAAHFELTDYLPEGTSFVESLLCGQHCVPFPPDSSDASSIYWDLGTLEPGEWRDIQVRVVIHNDTVPGTVIENCAEATLDGPDNYPQDNRACLVDTVRDFGPNLRISKGYHWNWEGSLRYDVRVENLGSQTLYDVAITDILPNSTSFSGNWWHNWSPDEVQFTDLGTQLVWTLDRIEPTWNWYLSFNVDLDGDVVGEQGLAFINQIEAPIPGDVYAPDNYHEVTAFSGPEIYIEKWLSGGELLPGEIVTFTVEFGNQSRWNWIDDQYGSHITDILPQGMTFISATAPWNPAETWHPDDIQGNAITWGFWPMWPDSTWWFDIVVQIDDTVKDGEVLVNRIEAYSDSPNIVEYDWDNNVFELPLTIDIEDILIYLPLIFR